MVIPGSKPQHCCLTPVQVGPREPLYYQSVRLADNSDQYMLLREESRDKDDNPQEEAYNFRVHGVMDLQKGF